MRVVVTGMGAVSPLGIGVDKFREGIFSGKNGVDTIPELVEWGMPVTFGGKVWDYKDEDFFEKKEARRLDKFSKFAIVAAEEAWKDADIKDYDPYRVATIVATGMGGLETLEKNKEVLLKKGPRYVSALTIPMLIPNMAGANIALRLGLKGQSFTPVTACASSLDAIGIAYRLLKSGTADMAVVGGTEASITPLGISSFASARALSRRNNDPKHASRPFDKDHDGFVMAEGAAVLVIEALEHAMKRGAKIYAEIVGYGATSDAYHITAPNPEADTQAKAIEIAIKEAGIGPEDIDYVNAHGTSTPANDTTETKVLKKALGEHAYKVHISSTKSMTGHLLGGAGAIESIATILAINESIVPPTINFEEPDPECDLNYTPNEAVKKDIRYALKESFGFGGHNSAVIFKRWEE